MTDALTWQPWAAAPELLAPPTAAALAAWEAATPGATATVQVAAIDPDLADTAAFCERYGVTSEQSANCVVVAGRRGELTRHAACLVLATTRADVNGVVRKRLDARKASFAPLEETVAATSMEYGGITPVGLPGGPGWAGGDGPGWPARRALSSSGGRRGVRAPRHRRRRRPRRRR